MVFYTFSTTQGRMGVNLQDIIWAGYTDQYGSNEPQWLIHLTSRALHLQGILPDEPFQPQNWLTVILSFNRGLWLYIKPDSISFYPLEVDPIDKRGRIHIAHGGCIFLDGEAELNDFKRKMAARFWDSGLA